MSTKTIFINIIFLLLLIMVFIMPNSVITAQENRPDFSTNFECRDIPQHYFIIDGRRYDNGQKAHICKGTEPMQIEVFHHNDLPFPNYTIWQGVESANGNIAEYPHEVASLNNNGHTVKAFYQDGEVMVSAEVQIVIVEVMFEAATDQLYGYDDNLIAAYSSFYAVEPINKKSAWKSIEIGKEDKFKAIINPSEAFNTAYFDLIYGNQFTVLSEQASSPSYEVNILAHSIPADGILAAPISHLDGCYSTPYTYLSSYPLKSKDLTIVVIHEQNDDEQLLDFGEEGLPYQLCVGKGFNNFRDTADNDLGGDDIITEDGINTGPNGICETMANNQNITSDFSLGLISNPSLVTQYVNDIYKQAVFNWQINIVEEFINFDLDRDGKLNNETTPGISTEEAYTEEMMEIIDNCNTCANMPDADHFMLFYDITTDLEHFGVGPFFYQYGFVYPQNKGTNEGALNTLAHELGHLAFGLWHPQQEPTNNPDFSSSALHDTYNLMTGSPSIEGYLLRKFQWDYINAE